MPAIFPQTPADAGTLLRDILLAFGPVIGPHAGRSGVLRRAHLADPHLVRRSAGSASTSGSAGGSSSAPSGRSAAYQKFLAAGITRSLVAAKARKASARTDRRHVRAADAHVRQSDGGIDRPRARRTDQPRLDRSLAAAISSRAASTTCATCEVEQILCDEVRITGVAVGHRDRRTVVYGDHYVAALPLERIAPLVNDQHAVRRSRARRTLRALAPNVEWMNGVQFYLRRDLPMAHGHVIHIDTEWALTSVSQLQFWRSVPPDAVRRQRRARRPLGRRLRLGRAGLGRPPRDAMLARRGDARSTGGSSSARSTSTQELLRDEDLHSWFLDPDIRADPARPRLLQQRRAAARQPRRHLGAAARRGHRAFRTCSWRPTTCARTPTSRRWKAPTRRRGARSTASSTP